MANSVCTMPARPRIEIRPPFGERFGLVVEMLNGDAERRFAFERRSARQHLVGGHAQRIEIAAGVDGTSFDLFGAHEQGRSHRHADLRQVDLSVGCW